LALEQSINEQPNNNNNNKKVFYVVKKRGRFKEYQNISYIDQNNSFRGIACFNSLWEALQYKQLYEQRLVKQYLKERKRGYETNNNNRPNYNKSDLKVFVEHEIPNIKSYY
jgi:hypothetical protein